MLSSDPGARAVERAWLLYTPVWGAITGGVMLGGFAERWGDVPLMIFGVVLALGALAAPWLALPKSPAERTSAVQHAASMSIATVVLALGMNYFQTPYFFDVLHMRYGFRASWTLEHNPLFLYLVTIPYFATYSVLACIATRLARARAPWLGGAVWAVVPFTLALLETVLNANPFMTRLFCYDDLPLMLWFGTLSYGVSFVLALPVWTALAEPAHETDARWKQLVRRPVIGPLLAMALVVLLDTLVLAGARAWVAPHFTTVVSGATGGAGGCLAPAEP
ncbi:MAG: hypothetical protein U0234_21635 [Sandaracinus sp.]